MEIIIKNSWSYFSYNYSTDELLNKIKLLLSYELPGSKYLNLPSYASRKILVKKIRNKNIYYFPTGLLNIFLDFLKKENIPTDTIEDQRIAPLGAKCYYYKIKPPELRYYQKEAVEKFLKEGRGVIESATGSGKSLIITEIIKQLSVNTLVIVPNKNILHQFYENLSSSFGKKMVAKIGAGKKELNKPITVATYQSLSKIEDSDFWKKIDFVVVDESHHGGSRSIVDLYLDRLENTYYRLGTTATYTRTSTDILELYGVCQQVIYSYPATQAIKDEVIVKPIISFIGFNHIKQNNLDWREEEEEYLIENEKYNNQIAKIAINMAKGNVPTIIFVDAIKHGEKLQNIIPESVFLHGKEKDNSSLIKAFNRGEIKVIIGTSVIGEGIDTLVARCGIIACGGKSEIETLQRVGRILRKIPGKTDAYIIDFMHYNTKYLQRYSKSRLNIYKSEYEQDIYLNPPEILALCN